MLKRLLSIGLGLLLAANVAAREEQPDIVGEALDPDSGALLYLEHYYCDEQTLACSVFYIRPDQRLIASKQIDFQDSLQAPELVFNDFRSNRELKVSRAEDRELVVDAGFDNFVRLQWDSLEEGDRVTFPFLLIDRDKPITMRAGQDPKARCDESQLCLEVRLDSWLLGALVDPIELTYDREEQRLRRFKGLSNLRTDEGKSQQVEIRYNYRDEG